MASSRLKSLIKLALLLGAPIALLFALFVAGVYTGQAHRAAVLGFERDWLGMDVVVPETPKPEPSAPVETPKPITTPTPVTPTTPTPTPTPAPVVQPTPAPQPTPTVQPTPIVQPTPGPAALVAVTDPVPLVLASPRPLDADLQARLVEPVRVRVKLLIDPELVDRRPDWIAYAQRHVAWASQVLEAQLGVRLELRGVVVWSSPQGSDPTTMLADLQGRSRDGADLLLGLTSRSFAGDPRMTAGPDTNLGHALVQANPGSRAPHLRGLLHAVGLALGGAPISDASSDAWRGGSFMANVLAGDSEPLDLDDDSRRRLLERKSLPFQVTIEAPPTLEDGEL